MHDRGHTNQEHGNHHAAAPVTASQDGQSTCTRFVAFRLKPVQTQPARIERTSNLQGLSEADQVRQMFTRDLNTMPITGGSVLCTEELKMRANAQRAAARRFSVLPAHLNDAVKVLICLVGAHQEQSGEGHTANQVEKVGHGDCENKCTDW